MDREELVKNPHSKPTNTRIGSGQCGYLHFTCGSLGWREISGRLGRCGVLPQKPSCRHVDEPKRPRTKQVGLATKMNNGHSTENSEEPIFIEKQPCSYPRFKRHGAPPAVSGFACRSRNHSSKRRQDETFLLAWVERWSNATRRRSKPMGACRICAYYCKYIGCLLTYLQTANAGREYLPVTPSAEENYSIFIDRTNVFNYRPSISCN